MQKRVQIKMMTDSLALLREIKDLLQNGEDEKAEAIMDGEISELKRRKEKLEFPNGKKEMCPQTALLASMQRQGIIYEDDFLTLIPIKTDSLAQQYLQVRIENAAIPALYDDEKAKKDEIDDVLSDRTFYCGIFSKESGAFTGYCGINNIYAEKKDLAIAILKKYRHSGYGLKAMEAFMKTVEEATGITHFVTRVDPENRASRILMKKLGFKPSGIDTFLIDDEKKLEQLEEENAEYITEELIELAKEFGVEPRKLLSHLLVYSIDFK